MPEKKEVPHTVCFNCNKPIAKSESNPIRSEDGKKWLGWGCLKCFPNAKPYEELKEK